MSRYSVRVSSKVRRTGANLIANILQITPRRIAQELFSRRTRRIAPPGCLRASGDFRRGRRALKTALQIWCRYENPLPPTIAAEIR